MLAFPIIGEVRRSCRSGFLLFAVLAATTQGAVSALVPSSPPIIRSAAPTPDFDGDDDAVALNRMIDSLPVKGGTLLLPRGEYLLKSRIRIKSKANVAIVGEGRSTLLRMSKGTGRYLHSDFPLIEASGCDNLEIRDLAFEGPGKDYGSDSVQTPGIYLKDSSSFCRITRCEFRDLNSGIRVENSSDCQIEGNSFRGKIVQDGIQLMRSSFRNVVSGNSIHYADTARSGMGIRVSGFPGEPAKFNTIIGNTVTGAKDEGIVAEFAEDNAIIGNTVSGCAYGIQLYDFRHGTVNGNIVSDCRLSGIGLFCNSPGRRITGNAVTGNMIRNCGTATRAHALCIASPKDGSADSNLIADNVIQGSATNGIDVSADYCLIRGNSIQSPSKMGICIANAAHCVVEGNFILGPGHHGIFGGGSQSLISGNSIVSRPGAEPGAMGILLKRSRNAVVSGNQVSGFAVGERVEGPPDTVKGKP